MCLRLSPTVVRGIRCIRSVCSRGGLNTLHETALPPLMSKSVYDVGKAHCNATAALVSIAANYSEAGGGGPPGSAPDSGCGPLTPALDAALTQRDAVGRTLGASESPLRTSLLMPRPMSRLG